ncbi:TfoX/Sxy family protein [Sulfitobacter sp. HNIBRBA3233]|uniref:TfoX/Sxy family protein n=1 Tax=Sulfitobacter marinivivus TaxID=3158558 RepID=UPI0032DF0F09
MSLSAGDIAHVTDLFSEIPDLTTRRMFGGLGLYCGGTIFALALSDGRLMLKAPEGPFAERMAALGGQPWTYTRKTGAQSVMPYWTVPDECLDDPQALAALAREAIAHLRDP